MSASEWARITDERDEAIYHLQELIGLARDCNLEEDEKFIEAEKFIDEYFDDE